MIKYYCDRCGAETSDIREQLAVGAVLVAQAGKPVGEVRGKAEQTRREFCTPCADAVYQKLVDLLTYQRPVKPDETAGGA